MNVWNLIYIKVAKHNQSRKPRFKTVCLEDLFFFVAIHDPPLTKHPCMQARPRLTGIVIACRLCNTCSLTPQHIISTEVGDFFFFFCSHITTELYPLFSLVPRLFINSPLCTPPPTQVVLRDCPASWVLAKPRS